MARRNDADESTNTNGGRSSSKKRSNAGATILGLSAIIAVTALAVLFGRSAVDAMNRNANAQLAKTQQELDDMRSRNQPQEPETEEVETEFKADDDDKDEIEQIPKQERHKQRQESPCEFLHVKVGGEETRLKEEIARDKEEYRAYHGCDTL